MTLSDEDQRVVFEIAFAIEDPASLSAVVLARELLLFARRVHPDARKAVAELFASITTECLANGEVNNVRDEADELPKMQS